MGINLIPPIFNKLESVLGVNNVTRLTDRKYTPHSLREAPFKRGILENCGILSRKFSSMEETMAKPGGGFQ